MREKGTVLLLNLNLGEEKGEGRGDSDKPNEFKLESVAKEEEEEGDKTCCWTRGLTQSVSQHGQYIRFKPIDSVMQSLLQIETICISFLLWTHAISHSLFRLVFALLEWTAFRMKTRDFSSFSE